MFTKQAPAPRFTSPAGFEYVHPVGVNAIARPCKRCNGARYIQSFEHVQSGECFRCNATGGEPKWYDSVEELDVKEAKLAKARARREANRQAKEAQERAEWEAKWEAERPQREAEEAKRQAEREAYEAELAKWKHLEAQVGDKVTVSGVVSVAVTIDTQYGASRLIVVDTPEREAVKLFTTAEWAWDTEKDATVTIAGTVKSFDEYDGKPQTVLNRPKRVS